ncbi:hypothetical protein E1262_21400 [Jiangella aurantiaca]|uniref:Uncharacterized protein n=1 Tax=Jiangella aurantiaca TaxID=2530373 RepID=A0A4R5A4C8_9ACTN|nr:hypothetical protein [Jiangella aurantiaca]TDD66731.1 hypothetical protein E1262_21400 [Jiangella aurantiaca]
MKRTSIIAAAAVAAILPTGPAAATAFGSADESATEFSQCMRERGLEDFPDAYLSEDGTVRLDGTGWVDPFSAEYLAALDACEALLPAGTALPGAVEPPAPQAPPSPADLETPAPPEAPPTPSGPEVPEIPTT